MLQNKTLIIVVCVTTLKASIRQQKSSSFFKGYFGISLQTELKIFNMKF